MNNSSVEATSSQSSHAASVYSCKDLTSGWNKMSVLKGTMFSERSLSLVCFASVVDRILSCDIKCHPSGLHSIGVWMMLVVAAHRFTAIQPFHSWLDTTQQKHSNKQKQLNSQHAYKIYCTSSSPHKKSYQNHPGTSVPKKQSRWTYILRSGCMQTTWKATYDSSPSLPLQSW